MNSEKDFKDALKGKLNEKQFQFDEVAWEQASRMLDATREENKKRPFPYFLVAGILLFVSLIGFYILKPAETTKEIASTNTVTENATVKNNETVASETKQITSEKETTNSLPAERSINNEPKKELEKTNNAIAENKTPIKEKLAETKRSRPKNKTDKTKAVIKNAIVIDPKNEEDNNTVNTKTQQPKKVESVENETTETKTKEVAKETAVTPVEEIKADQLVTITSMLPVNTGSVKEPLVFFDLPKTVSETKEKIKEPVHFISFEAGVTYLFGWNNPDKKDANGINPVVGLNYANVSKPITFSFGIHYTMVRNLSYSSHTVTTTRYNFGEESDVMVFTPTTMHYLTAPIRIGYSLNSKNTFGLGYNVGYLFNLNSNVELYAQTAGKKGNATVLKTSGYTQGFKTFDQQVSVFYKRNLSKDLWLNAEFMYGLTDVKDNKFFNSPVFERNTGLKITLVYNLFKK